MKLKIIQVLGALIFILVSCERKYYEYIDKSTLYKFEVGDTLVYKGDLTNDTFVVDNKSKDLRTVDKSVTFEILRIDVSEITKNCKYNDYNYCDGFRIVRHAEMPTSLYFRNDFTSTIETSGNIAEYAIGKYNFSKVYILNFSLPAMVNNKAVKLVYYTHKYGIIAYETVTGEKFELEEKYISV